MFQVPRWDLFWCSVPCCRMCQGHLRFMNLMIFVWWDPHGKNDKWCAFCMHSICKMSCYPGDIVEFYWLYSFISFGRLWFYPSSYFYQPPVWSPTSLWSMKYEQSNSESSFPRNLQRSDPRFTDPEKTWVSNSSSLATYFNLGVCWDSFPFNFWKTSTANVPRVLCHLHIIYLTIKITIVSVGIRSH